MLGPRHLLSMHSLRASKWASLIYFISWSYLFSRTALVPQKKRCCLEMRMCLRDRSSIRGHRISGSHVVFQVPQNKARRVYSVALGEGYLSLVTDNSNKSSFLVKKFPSRWDLCYWSTCNISGSHSRDRPGKKQLESFIFFIHFRRALELETCRRHIQKGDYTHTALLSSRTLRWRTLWMLEVHTGSKSVSMNSWKQKETLRLLLNTRLSPQVQELHETKIVRC